jgi:hypothetical protein
MVGDTQPLPVHDVAANRRGWKQRHPPFAAAHCAIVRRDPRSPTIALVGITQATGVLTFDFAQSRGAGRGAVKGRCAAEACGCEAGSLDSQCRTW